jgi:hypothetical protein
MGQRGDLCALSAAHEGHEMEGWQVDLLKYGATAIVTGIGGWWAHWKWVRQEQIKADLREQQRQAEYDEFKKKRRLIGAGEAERMERADRLTEIIIKLKTHQITLQEFNAFKDDLISGRKRHLPDKQPVIEHIIEAIHERHEEFSAETFTRMADFDPRLTTEQKLWLAQRLLAVLREKGPNDYPVGYDAGGIKVEWIPSEEDDIAEGAAPYWPMRLLRTEDEIHAASEEFFEKVWWNRHQIWLEKIANGEEPLKEGQQQILETAKAAARRIEDKYGREKLGWDDFEWGMVNGKLSALRWVTGAEWDFLDT